MPAESVARLYAILPRAGDSAVVFRRGPSKIVQLIRWDLTSDTFEFGQWFKGRIYERRSDLSPSGDRLVYFATKHKRPWSCWTAISKPPYLTALALWFKVGAFAGGGLFNSENALRLNHHPLFEMQLADGFRLPQGFCVECLSENSGRGGDEPIRHMRMLRDGWILEQEGQKKYLKNNMWLTYDPPFVYTKQFSLGESSFKLHMRLLGLNEKQGSWSVEEFALEELNSGSTILLGKLDWADVDGQGDLLFAKEGCIFRLSPEMNSAHKYDLTRAKKLCDFNNSKFAEVPPPPEAKTWD